ncbi:MAG TPA: hypothetical protein VEU96_25450 [Bryobacteraceae bacterium]|nr:hypothetical protein [Bryobacteraceae bacterium]
MTDLTRALLADTRNIAREQIEHIFEERMAALTAGVEAAVAESLAEARRYVARKLNQSVRRLRGAENDEQWTAALVEAARAFCDRAMLFQIQDGALHSDELVEDVPLRSAPAFANAVESKDTVIAMRVASEMSPPIAALAGEDASLKFYIFPVIAGGRVTALLYADSGPSEVDSNALELLATVAGMALDSTPTSADRPSDLVQICENDRKQAGEDRELHSQAQRFARVQVAEIRLYKSEEVKNGRSARDLYASLKTEIDSARESYRKDFLSAPSTMVDYLHQELVRTLANNDAELLGPGYPGPLA